MISLGRRDARKELELGLGFGGEREMEMEDTELEEGEACSSYNNNNNNIDNMNNDDEGGGDYDASIDPDVALSYIDDKLQDVLGHFKKDFEGGVVSVENLGAKFGGYGSFLPVYQRSPVWSHPRTPSEIQTHNAAGSSSTLPLEGGRHSSVSSSTAPQSARAEPASMSARSVPAVKASSFLSGSAKKEACVPSAPFADSPALKHESRKSVNLPDQKMLKVRIKMGSKDNLSTQKNAAIYSGLGLDVSPSSSLDGSPSESEGMSEPQDALLESPYHILQIMTSFPVHGGLLLSPLPRDLVQLIEKQSLLKDGRHLPEVRVVPERSGIVVNGSDSLKGDGKMGGGKKIKSRERNQISAETKGVNKKDCLNGDNVMSKETDYLDSLACEELVSNTLKLPLLSNSYSAVADSTKGAGRGSNISKEGHKSMVRDKGFSDPTKEESLLHGWSENPKATSAGNPCEEKKSGSIQGSRKDGRRKGENPYNFEKNDSNASRGRKAQNSESIDPPKLEADWKATSQEVEGMKLPSGIDRPSSEGKKKLKGSQNHENVATEGSKESLRFGSPSAPKSKKSVSVDDHKSKGDLEDLKSQKNTAKTGDRYRDFFGDIELEQEENLMSPVETDYEDGQKDVDALEKNTYGPNNAPKERSNGKKNDRPSASEAYPTAASNGALRPVNGLLSDNALAATAPVLIQDSWVGCDKCHKWRLLPLGTKLDDLPERWHCRMLNWLPGKNRCSVPEEETTNALIASYQIPAPEGQGAVKNSLGGVTSKVASCDVQPSHQTGQSSDSLSMPAGVKKKQGFKELSQATIHDGATKLSNHIKKNSRVSVTNGSLNDANCSSIVSEPDNLKQKQSKTADFGKEKHKDKQKEKSKELVNFSVGDDGRQSKIRGKRDSDKDSSRASKKMRTDNLPTEWMPGRGGAIEKADPIISSGKNVAKHNDRSSKDSKYDRKTQASARKLKDEVQVSLNDEPMDRVEMRKRKVKEDHDAQIYPGSVSNAGHNLQDDRFLLKEEFSEHDYRKEKRGRVSRSEGKESSASKGHGRTDKKGSHRKSYQQGQDIGCSMSQRSLDGVDPSKRESGSLHPSAAATSSSSKVSGSHKTRANFVETKGSPVESVSSSPMRVSKPEKFASTRRNLAEKDDFIDAGYSLRRCSDVEDDGGSDRSGTVRKEKVLGGANNGILDSSVDIQENGISGGKAKAHIPSSPDVTKHRVANGGADHLCQDTEYPSKLLTLDRSHDDSRHNENRYGNGSHPSKSLKGCSSRSKEKNRTFNSELDDSKPKLCDSYTEPEPLSELKQKDSRNKIEEKLSVKPDENENRNFDKKESTGVLLGDGTKRDSLDLAAYNVPDVKAEATCGHDMTANTEQNALLDCGMASGKLKPLSGGSQNETVACCLEPTSGSHRENGADNSGANASDGDNTKVQREIKKVDNTNGNHHNSSRNSISNGHRVRDLDAPSPIKRDSSSQAATNALKEAKNLKHMADRLKKHSGSNTADSTRLYFEAALKFLHGASLLESSSGENMKTGEMIQSMQMYSSTAKLCEYIAHEYEKSKDMATAALAYKCIEVAYMRVIYCSYASVNRDRHELQTALQAIPPGESPSSSASDIDNLNQPTTVERVPLARGISSPQVPGSHVIAARNRPNFVRLLNFAQEVNFAMEASRKSRNAFAAANISLGEAQCKGGISSIKSALDFSFQDVEGFLRLVRLAFEANG